MGSETDTETLETDPVIHGEAPLCVVCGAVLGRLPWRPPHRADLTLHGSTWGDFAFRNGSESEFLITERAARVFNDEHVIGLEGCDEVEIARAVGGREPPQYLYVAVVRSGAAVDFQRSSLTLAESGCDQCLAIGLDAIHGFALAEGSWTGEDIFLPRGLPGVVVATRRFVEVVNGHGLTNVRFIPTESYDWDETADVAR